MFLSSWSVALTLLSLVVLTLCVIAVRTAIKILRYWNPASDSNRQIRLENETWLSSTLVQYAMGFQVLSLLLFVLAADNFSRVISGAMCATGALTANPYGLPVLCIKLLAAYGCGGWLVFHSFDISSERYPLLSKKYALMIGLLPLLLADALGQTLYIANLKADIITSCCAVVFGEGGGNEANLLGTVPQDALLILFYGTAVALATSGHILFRRLIRPLLWLSGAVWFFFVCLSLVAITTVFSSYVYAMPYHHCPFCILKTEYHSIGLWIYGTLLPAGFFGVSAALSNLVPARAGLEETVHRFQKRAVLISSLLLFLFLLIVSYHYVMYRVMGGEG